MTNITTHQSSPLHLENTIGHLARNDLNINNAFSTYREMMLDGVISGSMSFLKSVMSRSFKIGYHEQSTQAEKALITALNTSLEGMQPYGMKQLVGNFLTSLEYGSSLNEIVLERVNGKYVFKNISPIHVSTVNRYEFNRGNLERVVLDPADNDGLIDNVEAKQTEIEGSKLLLVRLDPSQDHPLGRSLLHGCYKSWKMKEIISEYETIGVAKNLSGVLNISIPSDHITKYLTDPASDEAIYTDNLLRQAELLHAGKSSYLLTPSDTYDGGQRQFEVTTVGGEKGNSSFEVGSTIARLNNEIQLSLQTMLLSLGSEGGGSFALSDSKTQLLTMFVKHLHKTISSEFKKAIRLAFETNGLETSRIPELIFEDIEQLDWEALTKGWANLANAQLVTPDQGLESHLREIGKAPKAKYSERIGVDV
ncbi:hypothetical protein M8009_18320 [Halomonas sp. ATCH28]|uniref:DUF4055 domain-containing protein n=1 Tax=Halomonas gemina TaxID=2945105 RepID=A0ABT0T5P0_9GAMM|nr:hypothetical protein [Halomonas gemina]MCL7942238.1 hypothetical protein [Halomonas gemina]